MHHHSRGHSGNQSSSFLRDLNNQTGISRFTGGPSDLSFTTINQSSAAHPSRQAFDARDYVSDGVSEKDIHIYKQAFDLMDQHAEGWLNPGKIRTALKEFGKYNASIELVYQIYADFDNDMNGKIDFEEFVQMMKMQPNEQDTEDDIEKIYHDITQYKDDGEGISPADLVILASNSGETLALKDAIAIVRKFDPTGERISLEDFVRFNKSGIFDPK